MVPPPVADFRNSREAVTIDFACEPDRDDTGTIGILPLELQLIVFVPSSLMPFLFTMNIGTCVPPCTGGLQRDFIGKKHGAQEFFHRAVDPIASRAGPGGRLHAERLAHGCLLVKREPGFPIHATDQVMQTRLMRQDHESHEVAVRREVTRHSNEMLVGGQCRSRENYLAIKIRSSVRKK